MNDADTNRPDDFDPRAFEAPTPFEVAHAAEMDRAARALRWADDCDDPRDVE